MYINMHHFTLKVGENTILNDINFRVYRPGLITILGESGAGKSTLAKVISGQFKWSQNTRRRHSITGQGCLKVLGKQISDWGEAEIGAEVGFVFQHPIMFPGDVEFNLVGVLCLADTKIDISLMRNRAREALKAYGLTKIDFAMRAQDLSGGQQQRLAILRATLMNPRILILDEVTSGLDDPVTRDIVRLIKSEAKSKPVILITHDTRLVNRSDRVIVMKDGRIVFDGPPDIAQALDAPTPVKRFLNASKEIIGEDLRDGYMRAGRAKL